MMLHPNEDPEFNHFFVASFPACPDISSNTFKTFLDDTANRQALPPTPTPSKWKKRIEVIDLDGEPNNPTI